MLDDKFSCLLLRDGLTNAYEAGGLSSSGISVKSTGGLQKKVRRSTGMILKDSTNQGQLRGCDSIKCKSYKFCVLFILFAEMAECLLSIVSCEILSRF